MDKNKPYVPNSAMDAKTPPRPLSVSLLAMPETTPAAIYSLLEAFISVGTVWPMLTGEETPVRRIVPRIVAAEAAPFTAAMGAPMAPHAAIDDVPETDVVVLTDLEILPGMDPRGRWAREVAWVRRQYEAGAFVCSVCTGSLLLAEAGLLDDQEATTHWSATDLFRTSYPQVRLRPERILCPTGPGHQIVTGGGSGSWSELALYIIGRYCGEGEAVRIAKIFVLGDRTEGQLRFSAMARQQRHEDAAIGACQTWIADHYAAANPVARMVAHSGLAERTFKRRFKAATGYTPVDYVQALRVEEAKQILETTTEPTDGVAQAVGYEDPAFFRRLFKRRTGVSPARYRQRFQAITRMIPLPQMAEGRQ